MVVKDMVSHLLPVVFILASFNCMWLEAPYAIIYIYKTNHLLSSPCGLSFSACCCISLTTSRWKEHQISLRQGQRAAILFKYISTSSSFRHLTGLEWGKSLFGLPKSDTCRPSGDLV